MQKVDGYTIGQRVKQFRKLEKLTQEQLAEKAGTSVVLIGNLETSGRNITIDTLAKILTALDITYLDFFSGLEENTDLTQLINLLATDFNKAKYIKAFIDILKIPE